MKKFVYFVILIMILSLLPLSAYAENDVIGEVYAFIEEQGRDPDNSGHKRYCADMKGGGTFNMLADNEKITCWIEDSQTDGESFYKYEFKIILKAPFTGDIEWNAFIEDENGINSATGKMDPADNKDSELVCDEYSGDGYLKKSFMENAHNFRDALILAIANDLNYYLDRNLDFVGINPQFFCIDGHSFGEWVYQKNATKQANGTEKRQCTTCFATEEREVEGTMIQAPENSGTETASPQAPEQHESDKPVNPPKPVPDSQTPPESEPLMPDYQFETEEPENDNDPQHTEKPKKELPPYAFALGIALAVVVVAVAVFIVIKTKSAKKDSDDEDLFGM